MVQLLVCLLLVLATTAQILNVTKEVLVVALSDWHISPSDHMDQQLSLSHRLHGTSLSLLNLRLQLSLKLEHVLDQSQQLILSIIQSEFTDDSLIVCLFIACISSGNLLLSFVDLVKDFLSSLEGLVIKIITIFKLIVLFLHQILLNLLFLC